MPAPAARAASQRPPQVTETAGRQARRFCFARMMYASGATPFQCSAAAGLERIAGCDLILNEISTRQFSPNIHSPATVTPHTLDEVTGSEGKNRTLFGSSRHDAPTSVYSVLRDPPNPFAGVSAMWRYAAGSTACGACRSRRRAQSLGLRILRPFLLQVAPVRG